MTAAFKLWNVTVAVEHILNDCEDGVISPEQDAELDRLSETFADKIKAVEQHREGLDVDIASLQGQERYLRSLLEDISGKRKRLEAKRSKLGHFMAHCIERMGLKRVEFGGRTVTALPGRSSVKIVDESLVPAKFKKVTKTCDKKRISEAQKSGEDVPGAIWEVGPPTVRVS